MTKTRIISIAAALAIAVIFGTGQFDRSKPSDNIGRETVQGSDQRLAANEIAVSALPGEAQKVVRLIYQGGPFRYDKDGTVFQNREKLLPDKKRGFYREYTVRTPGEETRGARRIVAGGPSKNPDVMYYTKDHYRSFLRIQGAQP